MSLSINIYRIEQDQEYKGDDWWEWSLWIEGDENDLNKVDYVIYRLHPTFRPSVINIADRATKFRLSTEGWGVFRIHVKVCLKNRDEVELKHDLMLTYPDNTPNMR
jgi:transcription initiation factor IIF auxiliary subunit